MKISLAWLFDHIEADWHTIDISLLVERFNKITAEIEGYHRVEISFDNLSGACIIEGNEQTWTVRSSEWDFIGELPMRKDCVVGDRVLIYRDHDTFRWATGADLGGIKEDMVPPLADNETLLTGDWKKNSEKVDYIFDVDNKSLTHRPDMWSHRGFAREIAAFFDLPLKCLSDFIVDMPVHNEKKEGVMAGKRISIQDKACDRFSCLYFPTIERKASSLGMVIRLARIDSKSIDAFIDLTNYVMFDIGQPMHAFDADALQSNEIVIRKARNKEVLPLLGNETVELTDNDLVVGDSTRSFSLAGIKGGSATKISVHTKAVFLESAHFDATAIRLTSAYHKKRTESSIRFEKNIDGMGNTDAIKRFLKLADQMDISYVHGEEILSLGDQVPEKVIEVAHSFIEQRLGVVIDPVFVINILQKLAFKVQEQNDTGALVYTITVPYFRATKDIGIPEDIVEEVGRFYGYGTIPLQLPLLRVVPKNNESLMRIRAIKKLLVDAGLMRELYTYSFFDESFLHRLGWEPDGALSVQNPVSENWQRLVTSLIPNMIKAVEADAAFFDQLRFFECARVWHMVDQAVQEKEVLSGIIFDKKNGIDFYEAKSLVQKITDMVKMTVSFESIEHSEYPWFSPYKTARIMHKGVCVGTLGMVPSSLLHRVTEGHAFVFEYDIDFLRAYKKPIMSYEQPSRYPVVERDMSMLVPLGVTVAMVIDWVKPIDERIFTVTLIDFFEKKEWVDQRSLTIRLVFRDMHKTMQKEEIDAIMAVIGRGLAAHGAVIR